MKPIYALERILLKYTKNSVSRCLVGASARELVSLPDHCSSSQGWQQIYSGTTLTMERLTLEKIISQYSFVKTKPEGLTNPLDRATYNYTAE